MKKFNLQLANMFNSPKEQDDLDSLNKMFSKNEKYINQNDTPTFLTCPITFVSYYNHRKYLIILLLD